MASKIVASKVELERQALNIFGSVVELEGEARTTELARQCHNRPTLLTRVQALLDLDDAADGTPDELTAAAIASPSPHLSAGTLVGNYRITKIIAVGGMGAVYQAERADGAFERTVAIKFIHSNLWSKTLAQRFDEERRIMSRLQHPNITALLDGGTTQDQPYLVMEYVEGSPFAFSASTDRTTQLQRFAKVCGAVAHAHNNLILHRDIKPDNVLIDIQGHPKLLDFGIAKLTETVTSTSGHADLTGHNSLPMTPQYSAPEVLAGEPATVASDIYGLGLLLYEVLTGKRPYELKGKNLIEAAQLADRTVATKGLTANNDINTILATALHRDKDRRYPSVSALQQDVQNFLQRRPIAARADNILYTATRFVQRHVLGTIVSAAAMAALVTMLFTTLAASKESERQRVLAEQNLQTAEYSTNFLLETLTGASPLLGAKPLVTIDEALAAAEERLGEEMPADVYTQARLLTTLGVVFSGREDVSKAEQYLLRAQALLQANPDLPGAVALHTAIASAYSEIGRPKTALQVSDRAIALRAMSTQPNHIDFARALLARAAMRQVTGDYDGTRTDVDEALLVLEQQDQDVAFEYASAHMALGYIEGNHGNYVEAEKQIREALEYVAQAGVLDSANGIQAQFSLAQMLVGQGREKEGINSLEVLIQDMRASLGPSHQRVLWSVATLGSVHTSLRQPKRAVALMEPLLELVESQHEPQDELYAYFLAKLGYAMCRAGRYQEGLVQLDKSLISRRLVYPENHWTIPDVELAQGYCYMEMGQDSDATQVLRQAKQHYTAIFGPEHKQVGDIGVWLEEIAARSGQ